MENIRCVIANMPQQMLVDIVENIAQESGITDIVDQVANVGDIPAVLAHEPVDLLILGMKNEELPEPCLNLMNRYSNLPILGLVDDGRRLAVYLNNFGKNEILKIISALHRTSAESLP